MGLTLSFFIIYSLFFLINIGILWNDISYRKIPNIFLGFLLLLLPIWYYMIPGSTSQLAILLCLSSVLLLGGILINKNNGFFGSGDIKYIAVLILFLGTSSLSVLIGNIGFLTLCILFFWWLILLGYCYFLRGSIGSEQRKIFFPKIEINTVLKKILILVGDWIIIGFFLSLVMKNIIGYIFGIIPMNSDFYFIISLFIFLARPALRYLLVEWAYRIFPLFGMIIFFGLYIQNNGGEILLQELYGFIVNIWKFAIGFMLIYLITNKIFLLYDSLIQKTKTKNYFHTIPYSLVIFGGFISLYYFEINFIDFIRNVL